MRPAILIGAEGIAQLVSGHWLDRSSCGDPAAVAAAIVHLANAALDAGLRPRYRMIR